MGAFHSVGVYRAERKDKNACSGLQGVSYARGSGDAPADFSSCAHGHDIAIARGHCAGLFYEAHFFFGWRYAVYALGVVGYKALQLVEGTVLIK